MKKNNLNIAVYIDMENVSSSEFKLEDVMNSFLSSDEEYNCIFAIKAAYGDQSCAKKTLKKQIVEHNFNIIDTPKVGAEKNRADLLLSLDAFETLYLNNPSIDRYCFMTSDADFTVVADKLRKFGKEVWLVCKRADKGRAILAKSFDNLLFLEDFAHEATENEKSEIERLFIQALKNMNQSKLPLNVSVANDRMKAIDPSFRIGETEYKAFNVFMDDMQKKGYVITERLPSGENRITEILV